MWSPSLALFTICCYLVAHVSSKIVTTSFSSGGPVKFSGEVLQLSGETCRDQKFTLASINTDGATVSYTFTGTGLTLNCMTDTDRGLYTITVDGGNSRTVSGISSARSCTAIYSIQGLANAPHNFLLKAAKQNLTAPSTDSSAKFEFMSFEVTVPDDPTPTTGLPPDSTPDNPTPTISTPGQSTNKPDDNNTTAAGLSGGAIAGIVIAVVLGIGAVVFGIFFYKRYRARTAGGAASIAPSVRSHSIPPAPSPFVQHHQPATSQYMGYPELMPGSPPPRPDPSYTGSYGHPGSVPYSYSPPR